MTLARWESKSGKYRVELTALGAGAYGYQGWGCGGMFYAASDADAVADMAERVARGGFQPDDNTTPMRQVTA